MQQPLTATENKSPRVNSRKVRYHLTAFAFVSPWLIGFVLFLLYPLVYSFYLSLTNYRLMSGVAGAQFVSLNNYRFMLFEDSVFWKTVQNTLLYAALSVPFVLAIGLGAAILLNQPVRGRSIWRTIFFLPSLVPPVTTLVVFRALFDPGGGFVNQVLGGLGLPTPGWFAESSTALLTMVIMSGWGFGSAMIILLAGLQDIPRSLYEAAELDGAIGWARFRHITLPLLSPVIFFNVVLGFIAAFQVFTQSFALGGVVGWPGGSTLFYNVYLYAVSFLQPWRMGYGSALGWVLFLTILIATSINFLLSRRYVFYSGDS